MNHSITIGDPDFSPIMEDWIDWGLGWHHSSISKIMFLWIDWCGSQKCFASVVASINSLCKGSIATEASSHKEKHIFGFVNPCALIDVKASRWTIKAHGSPLFGMENQFIDWLIGNKSNKNEQKDSKPGPVWNLHWIYMKSYDTKNQNKK